RRRHTRFSRDWSSDVCSSDLTRNEQDDDDDLDSGADKASTRKIGASSPDKRSNQGKLLLDATCAPADIAYPTDFRLLDEARKNRSEERRVGKESGYRWSQDET